MHQDAADASAAAGEERPRDPGGHFGGAGGRSGGPGAGTGRRAEATAAAVRRSCGAPQIVPDVPEGRGPRKPASVHLHPHHSQGLHPRMDPVQREKLVPLLSHKVSALILVSLAFKYYYVRSFVS